MKELNKPIYSESIQIQSHFELGKKYKAKYQKFYDTLVDRYNHEKEKLINLQDFGGDQDPEIEIDSMTKSKTRNDDEKSLSSVDTFNAESSEDEGI